MIKKISSIVILVCIILFNITPIVMAADYAELGDSSSASGSYQKKQNIKFKMKKIIITCLITLFTMIGLVHLYNNWYIDYKSQKIFRLLCHNMEHKEGHNLS